MGNGMTIEEAVLQNLKVLPLRKKAEVLEFVEFLASKEADPHGVSYADALRELNENELIHLEAEFEGYDKLYPRQ